MPIPSENEVVVTRRSDGPTRRTLVKSAAWSVPVIAASVAVPVAAATGTPDCPSCIKAGIPLVGGLGSGAWTSQAVVAGNRAAIALGGAFGLDATACGITWENVFQPAFTFIITQATLTMSDGNTYNSSLGLGGGAGNTSTVGAFASGFLFTNVFLPNGGAVLGIGSYPVVPSTLTVHVTTTLQYGLGLSIECPMTLVWNLNALATGGVAFGIGTVNFSGIATV